MITRVLFVVPSLGRAGAETQVIDLINRLDGTRFEKHLFTFEAQLDQLERVRHREVTHHHCQRRYKFDLEPMRAIARLIDERQIDVVHCTLQFAIFMGWFAARLSKRRPALIVAVHTTINRNKKNELMDRVLYRWFMARCARVLFVCDAQREHWVAKFRTLSKIAATVHNGLEIRNFDPVKARAEGVQLRARLSIAAEALVIAHVAAFRPEKGHSYVLDALPTLVAENPSVVVLFAGDGPLRQSCERRVAEAGLEPNVRFLGSLADVRPVYGAADLMVLPSTSETFSMAMLEALALEVPVVASDVGGAREAVLQGVTGLLVPPAHVEKLVDGLKALAESPELRRSMGLAGRRLVAQRYTQQEMVRKTSELIEQVRMPLPPLSSES